MKGEPERRQALWDNCQQLKEGLRSLGFELGASESPILPLIIGDADRVHAFSANNYLNVASLLKVFVHRRYRRELRACVSR